MDERDIRRRTRDVVREMAPLREEKASASSSLIADLGYDSLGLVELLVALEQEFGMSVEEEYELGVETVADVEERVVELLLRRPSPMPGGAAGGVER